MIAYTEKRKSFTQKRKNLLFNDAKLQHFSLFLLQRHKIITIFAGEKAYFHF